MNHSKGLNKITNQNKNRNQEKQKQKNKKPTFTMIQFSIGEVK